MTNKTVLMREPTWTHSVAVEDAPGTRGGEPPAIRRREIYTLGRFRVVLVDDQDAQSDVPEAAWRHGSAKDLLTVLLVQPHQVMTRERAGALLWPRTSARVQRKRLTNAIWNLHRALGETSHVINTALLTTRATLQLCQTADRAACDGSCWVDASAFEAASRGMQHASTDAAKLLAAREALTLYQGDFLIDTAHNTLVEARQYALQEQWIQMLMHLSELWQRADQAERAVEVLLTVVEHAPDHVEAARQAASLLTQLGRSAQAARLLARARRRYKTLVGLEAPELFQIKPPIRTGG